MVETGYLTNHFLIAMPNLLDPSFFHSVTYICEHNEHGAMGVIINQPIELTMGELMEQLGEKAPAHIRDKKTIYQGGPVSVERGFVLHRPLGLWESTLPVTDEIGLTSSNDIIRSMADRPPEDSSNNITPQDYLITLGYAGWGAGQLEAEILENSWLTNEASPEILFHTKPELRWEAAASLLGVNIHQLTGEAGHA
jgi:putative transcriptional regulator